MEVTDSLKIQYEKEKIHDKNRRNHKNAKKSGRIKSYG